MSLLSTFTSAILPVLAIAAAGAAIGRYREVDVEALNTVTIYLLAPALVFHSLATTDLAVGTVGRVIVGVVAFVALMGALVEGVGRVVGERDPLLASFVMLAAFPNSGNFGIPLAEFAFGETGRATAVLYMSTQTVLLYTVGVYLASRGGTRGAFGGVRKVFTLPFVYAAAVAGLARWLDVLPPANGALMQTVGMVGNASIPVMLLILGLQLVQSDYGGGAGRRVAAATGVKFLLAPVAALAIALALGFQNATAARVFVLICAGPAAVTPLLLVIEFSPVADRAGLTAPEFVTATVFTTTLLSAPVVTALIAVLESGLVL